MFAPESKFNGGWFNRYVLNMETGAITCDRLSHTECEFPTFNTSYIGKPNVATYTACSVDNGYNGFFNGIRKLTEDGETTHLTLPPGFYGSEPLFAPAKNATKEDDGYLLEVVYDAYQHKSELQILRADNINDQVARLPLQHHLPHQFHGFYTPKVFC